MEALPLGNVEALNHESVGGKIWRRESVEAWKRRSVETWKRGNAKSRERRREIVEA